jgi:hypothetical protein
MRMVPPQSGQVQTEMFIMADGAQVAGEGVREVITIRN